MPVINNKNRSPFFNLLEKYFPEKMVYKMLDEYIEEYITYGEAFIEFKPVYPLNFINIVTILGE